MSLHLVRLEASRPSKEAAMPRGDFRKKEAKKPKKSKQRAIPAVQILPQSLEPERIAPKRKPAESEEES